MRQITALMMAATVAVAPAWATASTNVSVTGAVGTPLSLGPEQLQLLSAQTQTVSYGGGAGLQHHTYMGAGLWQVLSTAGITVNPTVKNDVLNRYVLGVAGRVPKSVRGSASAARKH